MNKTSKETRNKQLIARAEKQETGKLPVHVPVQFLEDCISQATMHGTGGTACSVHGLELQEDMTDKYPAEWMLWLFNEIGWWTYE